MKNNKGITMISLVITIIVLLILSSIVIYNSKYQLRMKYLDNLYADIESINSKVADYYLKNDSLPIFENAYLNTKEDLEHMLSTNSNNQEELGINVNDEGKYYVINLSKLDNLTLNYGIDYKNWTDTSTKADFQDLYIINEVTHQIYYPYGIKMGDEYFFSRNADENEIIPIELEEIEENWNVIINDISQNQSQDNEKLSFVANITIEGLLNNYNINSLEYAWTEEDIELEESSNLVYTKFFSNSIDEEHNTISSNISSKGISNTAEHCNLWIKVMDTNGKYSYNSKSIKVSPIILPGQYQKVEYIESTGTQYIDTNLILNQDSGFYIDFVPENDVTKTKAQHYINAGGAGGGDNIYTRVAINVYQTTANGELQFLDRKLNPKITKNERVKMSIINNVVTYNDGSTVQLTPQTITTSNSLIIFAAHNATIERFSTMKLYNLRLYNMNNIIRNFIPCYRKADNAKGLYDIVEGKFYPKQGSGDDFLEGENVY